MTLKIQSAAKDLGEFSVRRVLPSKHKQMVGPFVFFDHMGPAEFAPGEGIQVRPHPHIGLATITYLFDGEIIHRDDLGYKQAIQPGAVNLMTAGRGIVHSERSGDDLDRQSSLHGIQSWMALPAEMAEMEPGFLHYASSELPDIDVGGVSVRLIMGNAYGASSPVLCHSPTIYMACQFAKGSELTLPDGYDELGVYIVEGCVRISQEEFLPGELAVVDATKASVIVADEDCLVMVIGGTPLGRRLIWWNFVANSKERLEQAKQDWQQGHFGKVPGDDEFIPLPD